MTTTQKPSQTPYPGSASRRQGHALSLWAVAGEPTQHCGQGAPGRPTSSGAGGFFIEADKGRKPDDTIT